MAYIINKTDGTILATVADGQIDDLTTDLTLIGKNYSGFGESLNENFIKLLENFADTAEPENPVRGQIWFDTSELKLKVYTGISFQPVSSATISSTQPSTLGVGDLWFNDIDRQLYFFDGTTTILLGPEFSASQGLSGIRVVTILDNLNQDRVITQLYNNGVLLGIFSKDSFTPKVPINGFEGSIIPGFNQGTLTGLKFDVTATNAEQLGNQPAASYLRRDIDNIINGQLTITANRGILIGDAQQAQINVATDGSVQYINDLENKNVVFKVKRGVNIDEPLFIDTTNQRLSIYRSNPLSTVVMGGSLTVNGNLTVEGDTTTVNTSVLTIEDKNIVLGNVSGGNSDTLADGGGFILKGDSDHEFLWDNAEDAWITTEHMILETGKAFKIKDAFGVPQTVITATSLGESITSIPGVTSFGTQTSLTIGPVLSPGNPPTAYIQIEDNRISTLISNQDLEISPNGIGNIVLLGSPKITGLADPSGQQDAATKEYVDDTVETRSLVFSMDISDAISNTGIAAFLTLLAPPSEYRAGTVARILCTSLSNGSSTVSSLAVPNSTTEFITPDSPGSTVPGGTSFAVSNISSLNFTVPAPVLSVFRVVKTFQLVGDPGVWTFVS
jgi:hypothetical protein